MTIKATGYQWYWSYEYPDHGNASFDANVVDLRDPEMSAEDRNMWKAKFGDNYKRLLDTDNSYRSSEYHSSCSGDREMFCIRGLSQRLELKPTAYRDG